MRQLLRRPLLVRFMYELGRRVVRRGRIYLVGGCTAVEVGWRESTIDIDLRMIPESDELFRAIAALKDELDVNVELASPADFLPELPQWEDRSPFVVREGELFFHHYDFYSQALAKIERGHERDMVDVRQMAERGLIEPDQLRALHQAIEPSLFRFPSIDAASFRAAVESFIADMVRESGERNS